MTKWRRYCRLLVFVTIIVSLLTINVYYSFHLDNPSLSSSSTATITASNSSTTKSSSSSPVPINLVDIAKSWQLKENANNKGKEAIVIQSPFIHRHRHHHEWIQQTIQGNLSSYDIEENIQQQPGGRRRRSTPRRRRVFFIHVGKTGGETVRHTLKVTCRIRKNPEQQQLCWESFVNVTESTLSKATMGTMHCDLILPKKSIERATTFLFTLRNPITRVLSWFRYLNPINCNLEKDYLSTACNTKRSIHNSLTKNPNNNHNTDNDTTKKKKKKIRRQPWTTKFFTCFETIHQFIDALRLYHKSRYKINYSIKNKNSTSENATKYLTTNKTTTTNDRMDYHLSRNCTDLAWKTIQGNASPSSSHMYFNHKFYWQETIEKYPTLETWVIRTESLWEDMDDIEHILQASSSSAASRSETNTEYLTHHDMKKNVTHGSEGHVEKDDDLTMNEHTTLCCALKEEILIYNQLIQMATNLNDEAKNESLRNVMKSCNIHYPSSLNDHHDDGDDMTILLTRFCDDIYDNDGD